MATEPTARRPPRRSLLVVLGLAAVGLLVYWAWPAASPATGPSNQVRNPRAAREAAIDQPPVVGLGALKQPPPEPTADRNPFRFQPKAPPPAPAAPPVQQPIAPPVPTGPPPPPPPPPIPPIPLKFIGTLEGRATGKVAIFSDNRSLPVYGKEGEIILGQYKIVRIGVESVVMEYADGRGRQTIPLRGQ